jgi:hypothetical protein
VRRQFDRRVAAGAFGLAAVAVFATLGFAGSSGPVADRADPAAARELLTLMRAGERGSWSVTYDFTRTLAGGRTLRQSMQEARVSSLHVLRSGSVMTVEQGTRSFNCNLVARRPACTESAAGTALPPSEVLRVAVSVGAYTVAEDAGATIAGERARCFRVLAAGRGQLPDLGIEADLCLTANGVSLRQRIVRASGDTDERRARVVAAPVTRAAVRDVARGFDPSAAIDRG